MSKRSAGPQAQEIASQLRTAIDEARGKAEALIGVGENHANGGGEWAGGEADAWLEHWNGPVGTALRALPNMLEDLANAVDSNLSSIIRAGGGR